ncbi:hypothetical protein N7533_002863 [Penicillium manginii]|uniref:uncharacterized protein n=1 Tax=Penicillium manginii TaxID=203109 RepID=UPI0025497AE4|nr:uncharacterized protein N7533_002863 [Penicillium manginii]KAJ5764182.1 hypothetical protein N7533_002863 [Penicillium manginii]
MAVTLGKVVASVAVFAYGVFSMLLYAVIAMKKGIWFRKRTEKESLELQIARDRMWNLTKEYSGLSHHFTTLTSGLKIHFMSNAAPGSAAALNPEKPLVILIHGWPDSWAIWRYIASSADLQESANLVVIDLPGFGGSGRLEKYSATNVLEALTELILTLRTKYGVDDDSESKKKRTIVVAHDWGCVLSMRLAAEAPALADRWILSNAPLVKLVESNIGRLLTSAKKMFNTALNSPLSSRTPVLQAFRTLGPVIRQAGLSGYIFAMQLPPAAVRHFLTGGNSSLMVAIHRSSYGSHKPTPEDKADAMAITMGPSLAESKIQNANGDSFPEEIDYSQDFSKIFDMASYYRQGAASARWHKSLETIAGLHGIAGDEGLRRTSSGTGIFDEGIPGVLKAPSTIIWGQKDIALDPHICLDGIGDYLVKDSQVVMLPRSGHWTPIEMESRAALEAAIQWAVGGEKGEVEAAVQASYPDAAITVRR